MDFLKKGLNKVKSKVSQADLEKKINEATKNEMGPASIALLNEIASKTDDSESCKTIIKNCIKLLNLKPKMWKRILRTLSLIEHVIKTGSQNFVDGVKDERDNIRELFNFTYEEEDKDKGEASKNKFFYFQFYFHSKE